MGDTHGKDEPPRKDGQAAGADEAEVPSDRPLCSPRTARPISLTGYAGRAAQTVLGRRPEPADQGEGHPPVRGRINCVRVPVLLSGVLLRTYFPLILGQVGIYTAYTGLADDLLLGRRPGPGKESAP
ncbi:hypothetical protein NLX86_00105 [Streptomyces sp. A3M-1-3]|uniref:hypothetical protein n=1 Tax=Streptomyces sp. A3M-1-3 TaxID=2962044 RepID=UPI0020B6C015|nr:hypothetical protein [Streptomyces sp. A3M-1-3]MCP3816596.1 hypothetical protein [Streptomyces sp. A3M-1-3]